MEIEEIFLDDENDIQILEATIDKVSLNNEMLIVQELSNNPVEENFMKQLYCANNLIVQANNNIEVINDVTQKIVKNLAAHAAYRDYSSSDSESDVRSLKNFK